MLIIILNFFYLLGSSILLTSFLKNKTLQICIALLLSIFIIFQLFSVYTSGVFIDYKFYLHFNVRDSLAMIELFYTEFTVGFFIFSIVFYSLLKSKKIFNKHFYLKIGLFVSFLFLMSLKGGLIQSVSDLVSIFNADAKNMSNTLKALDMSNYIFPKEIEATKGKNIIVISLESYEKGYLAPKYTHLTPNISKLKNEWKYYDMTQTTGSEWTSGSLYTSLTGFPAFFNIHGNNIFESSFYTKITSVGHVLTKANYNTSYLIGNAKFSGTEDMLKTFQFNTIIDSRSLKGKYETIHWGNLHDLDLFKEAKIEVVKLKQSKKPFACYISTLSTHFPDGVYDKRMEKFVSKQENDLEFMVSAVDYLIGDFINFLNNEGLLENTVVYIYPDHLKMGDPSIFEQTGDRSLFMITNSKSLKPINNSNHYYQIDMPKFILEGAEIKHNAMFLTDYIKGDKTKFIEENTLNIAKLNIAGLKRENEVENK